MKIRQLLIMLTLPVLFMAEPAASTFTVACGIPMETTIEAEAATVYYQKCAARCSSIVDGLKSIGVDSSYKTVRASRQSTVSVTTPARPPRTRSC